MGLQEAGVGFKGAGVESTGAVVGLQGPMGEMRRILFGVYHLTVEQLWTDTASEVGSMRVMFT